MYEIVKSVIKTKNYELSEMLTKINTFWVQGELTDEHYTELVEMARENALPENSYADVYAIVKNLYSEIDVLKVRMKALEEGSSEGGSDETDEYPEYVSPTGSHDAYYAGAKMTFDGKKYICIAPEGVAVVWNPDVMPGYWQEVTE